MIKFFWLRKGNQTLASVKAQSKGIEENPVASQVLNCRRITSHYLRHG